MTIRHTSAATALLLVLTLVGCSGGDAPHDAAPSTKPPKPSPEASVDPVAQPPATKTPNAEPACDTIITASMVKTLTESGWTAEPQEFVIGDLPMTEGILCFWADYTVGSDHGQLYGWSPIDDQDAATAQESLLAEGWTREDGPEGTYITEDPQYAMGTDDEGYGMTYLFGDGWVKLADTKQSLVLIDWAG